MSQRKYNNARISEAKATIRGIALFFFVVIGFLSWTLSQSIIKPRTMKWAYHLSLREFPFPDWVTYLLYREIFPFLLSLLIYLTLMAIIFNLRNKFVVSSVAELVQALTVCILFYHINPAVFYVLISAAPMVILLWLGTNTLFRVMESMNREYVDESIYLDSLNNPYTRSGDPRKSDSSNKNQKSGGQQPHIRQNNPRSNKESNLVEALKRESENDR